MYTKRLFLPVVILVFFSIAPVYAAQLVGVMNLKAKDGIEPFLPTIINELFCAKIPEFDDYGIVAGPFIDEKILKSGSDELINCNRTDCYYLIGSGFDVNLLVAGTIGMQKEAFVINLMLLDVPNEKVIRKVVRKYDGDQYGLVDELEKYLQELFGVLPQQDNVAVAKELQVDETFVPEDVYEDIVSDYADEDTEIEGTPSLLEDDEKDDDEGKKTRRKVKRRKVVRQTPARMPGEGSLFHWGDDEDSEIILAAGYSMINLYDFFAYDYAKIGYRYKRNVFMLQAKINNIVDTTFINSNEHERFINEKIIFGGGLMYGYRLCQLFNDWVTLTPGITVGFYKYTDKESFYDTKNSTSTWEYRENRSALTETKSYFGMNFQIEVGNQINEHLAIYTYTHAQLLYVADPILFLDMGMQIGFMLP